MKAREIALSLGGRKRGRGYVACCVAHEDNTPSLSITDTPDGRLLVHCFAGCSQDAVIAALRARGLWPEFERQTWTADQRRDWARRRAAAEALAQRVSDWAHGRARALELIKQEADATGEDAVLAAAASALYRIQTMTDAELIAAFRGDVSAATHEQGGREDREHAERTAAVIVATIALADCRRAEAA
ncbi:MAG: hypothetical protein ABI972_03440 [Acidobacteriota bacterium]